MDLALVKALLLIAKYCASCDDCATCALKPFWENFLSNGNSVKTGTLRCQVELQYSGMARFFRAVRLN